MSIKRNSTSAMDHSVSIVRFGLIPGTSFYARKYARLTNKYFQLLQYESNGADYHDTVMVLADIPQDAEGYFYGVSDPEHATWEMSIRKQGSKIYWKIGAVEEDHNWEPGAHRYGFVDGKPLYDGQWLGITACTTFVVNLRPFVGARNNTGGLAEGDVITSIDIYQVLLSAHQTSASTTGTLMTYYPVTDGTTGTVAMLFETRTLNGNDPLDSVAGPAQQGVTPSSTPGEQVTYGVQLEDLRYITGSGYHDLMAIMADDGGISTDLNWGDESATDPYQYTDEDTDKTYDFAFSLYGVPIAGGTGGSSSFPRGMLLPGRKPKWSIWNDSVAHGFYIYKTGQAADQPQLRFNLFKNFDGSDTDVRLEWFEGYNQARNFWPMIEVNDNDPWSVEFNNAVPCKCDDSTKIFSSNAGSTTADKAANSMYVYNPGGGGSVKARLGNAAPWNFTRAQLGPTDYAVFGYVVSMMLGTGVTQSSFISMTAIKRESQMLSADTDAAVIKSYREDMTEAFASLNEEFARLLFDAFKRQSGTVPASLRLDLLNTAVDNPTTLQITSLQQLFNEKETSLTGTLNYGRRVVIDNKAGNDVYLRWSPYLIPWYRPDVYNDYYLWMCFVGYDGTQLLSKEFSALVEVTATDSVTGDISGYGVNAYMTDLIPHAELNQNLKGMWNIEAGGGNVKLYPIEGGLPSPLNVFGTDQTYSRFLQLSSSAIWGTGETPLDNTTYKVTLYAAASAPVLTVPYTTKHWQSTARSWYFTPTNSRAYLMAKPYYAESFVASQPFVKILVRKYTLSGTGPTWTLVTDGLFQQTVELYRNGALAATFAINLASKSTGHVDVTNSGYVCRVTNQQALPSGYWYDPDGVFEYNSAVDFYEIAIKLANTSSGLVSAGDTFSIDISAS